MNLGVDCLTAYALCCAVCSTLESSVYRLQGQIMLAVVVLCTVLALAVAVPSQNGWTHGAFCTLSFAADYKSYQWVYGNSQHTCKERADTDGSIRGLTVGETRRTGRRPEALHGNECGTNASTFLRICGGATDHYAKVVPKGNDGTGLTRSERHAIRHN